MQASTSFFKIFVDPGDLVVDRVPDLHQRQRHRAVVRPTLLEVPVDDDGMHVDALRTWSRRQGIHQGHLHHQLPEPVRRDTLTGRRHRLLDLARDWGSMVIDDDPYVFCDSRVNRCDVARARRR